MVLKIVETELSIENTLSAAADEGCTRRNFLTAGHQCGR